MNFTVDELAVKGILQDLVPKGTTVFTILRHVSASGTTRWIDLYVILDNSMAHRISGRAARLGVGDKYDDKRNAIKVSGGGMDMGFKLVYDLSRVLYDDGYALNHRWL